MKVSCGGFVVVTKGIFEIKILRNILENIVCMLEMRIRISEEFVGI